MSALKSLPSWVKITIKAILAIGLITWVVERGGLDFSQLSQLLTPSLIFPCLLLTAINMALGSERWRQLILSRGVEIRFFEAVKLTLIGNFFNFAMPGAVGGDVIKGYYLARRSPGQKLLTALSVLVDRLIGFYAMLVMALAVMLLEPELIFGSEQLTLIFWGTIGFFMAFTLFFVFAFSRRNGLVVRGLELISRFPGHRLIDGIYRALHSYGGSLKVLVLAFCLSLMAQSCSVLFFWWVGQIMEQMMGLPHIPLTAYIIVVPLGFIVTALPLAPAGIGVGQAAFLFLFNLIAGQATSLGATAVTLFQMTLFVYGILGAVVYLRQRDQIQEVALNG